MAANVAAMDVTDELVNQFCAVTGADNTIGRQLLEICHGNMDMAIGMHMDQVEAESQADQPTPSSSGASPRSQPHSSLPHAHHSESGAAATALVEDEEDLNQNGLRAPIPQRHEVLVEDVPKFGFRGRRRTARSVFDGFRDFQAEARQQESMLVTGRALGKKHTLEDLFRPPIDITFKGSFNAARERGKSDNKWLLVNIQNVQEFSCQVLNRDIWSNFAVKAMVKKHFIFWQVYHDSDEGKKFMQFYAVPHWPHVAVIDPVTGENLVTWESVENSTFADLLKDFLEDHPSPENPDRPPAKRQKRENSIVDESEEAQMEAAIQASLSNTQQSATSSTSTIPISPTNAAPGSSILDVDSDPSDVGSDELETFTGSEDESSDAPATRNSHPRSSRGRGGSSSSQPRSFSAVSGQCVRSSRAGGSSSLVRTHDNNSSSSSAAGASAGEPFSRHSSAIEDVPLPSTSSSRDFGRGGGGSGGGVLGLEDSENENSLGFRESYGNTPNSVDLVGGRSWEFHTLDSSSSNSSSMVSGTAGADTEDDATGCDRHSQPGPSSATEAEASSQDSSATAAPWKSHFGDQSDPSTSLVVRFPDGKKEQLSLPCSSKLQALFVFCSSRGYGQSSYELVVNFPRRSLSSLDPGSSMTEAQLHPQETVFVQAR